MTVLLAVEDVVVPNPWETGMEHAMWTVLFLAAVIGLYKTIKGWDERRIKAKADCIARTQRDVEDRAVLYQIKQELQPPEGVSVRQAVDQVSKQVEALSDDHRDLHDRIDWVYEHLFQQTQRQQQPDLRIDRPEPEDTVA
jgi:hypothetical protein